MYRGRQESDYISLQFMGRPCGVRLGGRDRRREVADERLEAGGISLQDRGWSGSVDEEVARTGGRSLRATPACEGGGGGGGGINGSGERGVGLTLRGRRVK